MNSIIIRPQPIVALRVLAASCLFLAGLLLFAKPLSAGPISFTYDAAGRLVAADYGNSTNLFLAYDVAGNLTQSSAPGPALNSATGGGQVTFAWHSAATGFVLYSTPNLRSPITYTPVAVTPVAQNGQFTATINAPPGVIFYVLKK